MKPKHPMEEVQFVLPVVDYNGCECYDSECVEDLVKSVRHFFNSFPTEEEIDHIAATNQDITHSQEHAWSLGYKAALERLKR